jgi:transposase
MSDPKEHEDEGIEVLDTPAKNRRRRRYTAAEKRSFLDEAARPGSSISQVARKYRISTSQLFRWKRLMEEGTLSSLGANEAVVPESALKEAEARIRELERLLGKKTLEAEILKDAVEIARAKKWISRSLLPGKK